MKESSKVLLDTYLSVLLKFKSFQKLKYWQITPLSGAGLTGINDRLLRVVTLRARCLKLLGASTSSAICAHNGRLNHHEVSRVRVKILSCEHPTSLIIPSSAPHSCIDISHGDNLAVAHLHGALPGAVTLTGLGLGGERGFRLLNPVVVEFLPLLFLPLLHF